MFYKISRIYKFRWTNLETFNSSTILLIAVFSYIIAWFLDLLNLNVYETTTYKLYILNLFVLQIPHPWSGDNIYLPQRVVVKANQLNMHEGIRTVPGPQSACCIWNFERIHTLVLTTTPELDCYFILFLRRLGFRDAKLPNSRPEPELPIISC